MSDKKLEQRISINFCVKIGTNASETLALLLLAYGDYATKKFSVFNGLAFQGSGQVQDHACLFLGSQIHYEFIAQGQTDC
jgi:hypothetical protein